MGNPAPFLVAMLLIFCGAALTAAPADAQRSIRTDPTDSEEEGDTGDSEVSRDQKLIEAYRRQPFKAIVGAGAFIAPNYLGSDRYEIKPMIVLDLSYKNRIWFRGHAAGVNLIYADHFRAGVMGQINFGRRDNDDEERLRGLGDIEPGLELGAFIEGRWKGFSLRLSGFHDVTGVHGGALARVRFQYETRFWRAFYVRANVFTNWASNDYADTFFGVTPRQSRNSGLPVYNPGPGIRDVGSSMALTFSFHRHWGLLMRVRYAYLTGDIADSPIVRARHQGFAGLAIFYRY